MPRMSEFSSNPVLVQGLDLATAHHLWTDAPRSRLFVDGILEEVWRTFAFADDEELAGVVFSHPRFRVGVVHENDEVWALGPGPKCGTWRLARLGWTTPSGFQVAPPASH